MRARRGFTHSAADRASIAIVDAKRVSAAPGSKSRPLAWDAEATKIRYEAIRQTPHYDMEPGG